MMRCLFFVPCLFTVVSAFSGTYPVVAWSSDPSALNLLPFAFERSNSPLRQLADNSDICVHDAIIIIEHPGAHAVDLRVLSPSSSIVRRLSTSATRIYPYVTIDPDIESTLNLVSSQCNFRGVTFEPGEKVTFNLEHKYVIHLKMPSLASMGAIRRRAMNQHSDILSTELDNMVAIFPNYIVIYTGSPLIGRQLPNIANARPMLELDSGTTSVIHNLAPVPGGILKRYQLLTPSLISALLIVFFILLPVILFAAGALTSIKSPLKGEYVKGYDAREKKLQ